MIEEAQREIDKTQRELTAEMKIFSRLLKLIRFVAELELDLNRNFMTLQKAYFLMKMMRKKGASLIWKIDLEPYEFERGKYFLSNSKFLKILQL